MAKRILVVDDEPALVEMIKKRLEANDYEVITSYGGQEALDKAETEKPDLILLDIMMPGMDGFQTLGRLRGSQVTRYTPVIMLTCKGETSSIFKAHDLGSTDYIIKPFDPKRLLDVIKRHI